MQNLRIPLRPGSMRTDVSQNDLGENVHHLVQNLKQTNKNEWENVRGYIQVLFDLIDVRAGIEVTDDLVGDRFLLLQVGTNIWRVDYHSGYEWDNSVQLTLPSDVEIPTSTTLRFFYAKGIVRITGAVDSSDNTIKVPLWYGYINRTIKADEGASYNYSGWFLVKASIDIDPRNHINIPYGVIYENSLTSYNEINVPKEIYHVKIMYIFDGGQYGLLKDIVIGLTEDTLPTFIVNGSAHKTLSYGLHFLLEFEKNIDGVNPFFEKNYPRLSGMAIVIGSTPYSDDTTNVDDISNWKVVDVLDLTNNEYRKINHHLCFYGDSTLYTYSESWPWEKCIGISGIEKDSDDELAEVYYMMAYFLYPFKKVTVVGPNGSVTTTVSTYGMKRVTSGDYYVFEIYFNDSVQSCFSSYNIVDQKVDFIFQKFSYDNTFEKWYYHVVIDLVNNTGVDLNTYRDFPAGTKDINPQYSHHEIIGDRAYCLSLESEENDIIRFSPQNQFDVFPQLNIIQSPAGDFDHNKAITQRDGRFIIIKGSSMSQGHYIGTNYYYDKDGRKRGMYPDNGFIVIDDILYMMDKDDIYRFTGTVIQGWLENEFLRQLYVNNVSTNSFFGHNPMDKEIWIFLNNYILVYSYEFNEFYYRKMNINPLAAILDIDRNFYLIHSGGVVLINHNQDTYAENVECKFISGFIDLKRPEHYKKLRKINFRVAANPGVNVTISARDPNESTNYSETKSINSTEIKNILFQPNMFFKELEVTAVFTASNNPKIKIKSSDLVIGAWRHV